MPYWICNYHVVWSTKNRQPLLNDHNEMVILEQIKDKSVFMKCPVLAINAAYNHVHVAVSIVPSVGVSDWVSKVKGVSSRMMNEAYPELEFHWQEGYGVVTFGSKNLPVVKAYVENQKAHHRDNTLIQGLERFE
jgi:REP element-mobilizing transposase RayT